MYKSLKSFINLPSPINISYWWNFGSLLGFFLMIQIISGLFLSFHYCPEINISFSKIIYIIQDISLGWLIHNIHMNGASFFFLFLYLHIGRNLYYYSFKLHYTWLSGTTIYLISMASAFLGYILPWGQMSFWGATVITNLISSTPYIGNMLTQWIWGGFSINNSTLNRFFSLHFILPFLILLLIFIHLYFLHITGSSNPLGTNSNLYKIPFNLYFTLKDLMFFNLIIFFFMIFILLYPYNLSDPENFMPANPLITPIHIQPEWYFLFAYTILRSIPNKLGGVIALISSLMILYFLPIMKTSKFMFPQLYFPNQILFWLFTNIFMLLTWLGSQPIEPPFLFLSQILTITYFSFFFSIPIFSILWEKIMNLN